MYVDKNNMSPISWVKKLGSYKKVVYIFYYNNENISMSRLKSEKIIIQKIKNKEIFFNLT